MEEQKDLFAEMLGMKREPDNHVQARPRPPEPKIDELEVQRLVVEEMAADGAPLLTFRTPVVVQASTIVLYIVDATIPPVTILSIVLQVASTSTLAAQSRTREGMVLLSVPLFDVTEQQPPIRCTSVLRMVTSAVQWSRLQP